MAETTTTTKTQPPAPDLWSRLPGDILNSIAIRLNSRAAAASSSSSSTHTHAIRLLRSVCKSWRCAIQKPSSSLISFVPLTFPHLNPNCRTSGHFSLIRSTIYFLLPPPSYSSSSSTAAGGSCWLLRVQEPPSQNSNKNGAKILYHPLNPLSKLGAERVPKKEAFPDLLNLL